MQILCSIKILINTGEWGSRVFFFGKLTRGYWRGLEKPEDLCTLPYHQGAHIPSNSLGPASHLKRGNNSNWTWWGYICISQQKCNTSVSIIYSIHTSTFVAGNECPDPHKVHSGQPAWGANQLNTLDGKCQNYGKSNTRIGTSKHLHHII
jgi:hypothetical protein